MLIYISKKKRSKIKTEGKHYLTAFPCSALDKYLLNYSFKKYVTCFQQISSNARARSFEMQLFWKVIMLIPVSTLFKYLLIKRVKLTFEGFASCVKFIDVLI